MEKMKKVLTELSSYMGTKEILIYAQHRPVAAICKDLGPFLPECKLDVVINEELNSMRIAGDPVWVFVSTCIIQTCLDFEEGEVLREKIPL